MRLLNLVLKMQAKSRNKLYTSKQTQNKVALLFLNVKMLGETFDRQV